MTLKKLMELSSDDTWFCVYRRHCGSTMRTSFRNVLRDPDAMQILNPLLRRKISKISIERLPVLGGGTKTPLIAVRLEDQ